MTVKEKTTPMMAQWHRCKEVAGEALLFFRMGDFYEAFYQDAVTLSKELDLTLTKRQEIPMAGVPWHSSSSYIDRLVAKGHRVAIAEQTEARKGLMKREVVRFVTPGTMVNLPDKANNFFAAVARVGKVWGLAALDLTTAEFIVSEFEEERALVSELHRLRPKEFLVQERDVLQELSYDFLAHERDAWHFDHETAHRRLANHFGVHSMEGFGLKGMTSAIKAGGALLAYLQDELRLDLGHMQKISPYSTEEFLELDRVTQRNLELEELRKILDETETAMGGRLLRKWLYQPLLSTGEIEKRQEEIERLLGSPHVLAKLREHLGGIRDIERLMMRISSKIASPKDLLNLQLSLEQLPKITPLPDLSSVTQTIADRLDDEGAFRRGFCEKLDELLNLSSGNKDWLAEYQNTLRENTGIKALKVGYNRVFGYYIEVGRGSVDRVPSTFHRRQTLTNAERFIDPELKTYETRVLSAEEELTTLEQELFRELCENVCKSSAQIFEAAAIIARIDALASLAFVAKKRGYIRPQVDESDHLSIVEGRHPVVEASPTPFIPNDTKLEGLTIITGPNMGGKSTYIRQTALIVLMAQMGSFVPAKEAHIGIIDKLFTRIGASDDLSRGQSTFMVEMLETANILNNATSRSLVILDEVGRGTSTYDGLSIAWAVAEHLIAAKTKTLFATHYGELTELPGSHNCNLSVEEREGEILFLHKIVPGAADRSYGIHVAKLAGLPLPVIERAHHLLKHLEGKEHKRPPKPNPRETQLTLF